MNPIPGIGQTRGIFEIFVPGVFLLSNIVGAMYALSYTHQEFANILSKIASHSTLSLILLISFGYLLGMVLRVFMTNAPDKASSWYLSHRPKKVLYKISSKTLEQLQHIGISDALLKNLKKLKGETYQTQEELLKALKDIAGWEGDIIVKQCKSRRVMKVIKQPFIWATESFPYFESIGIFNANYLKDPSVREFYEKIWLPRATERVREANRENTRFINFCKTLLCSKDPTSMIEISISESINRYISGMFYSLIISFVLLSLTLLSPQDINYIPIIDVLLGLYVFTIWGIVAHFRFMRIKEATQIFDASYLNRDLFCPPESEEELQIGKDEFREQQQEYPEQIQNSDSKTLVRFEINQRFEEFDERQKNTLIKAIADKINISPDDIEIVYILSGSTNMLVELRGEDAKRLLRAFSDNDPFFEENGIKNITARSLPSPSAYTRVLPLNSSSGSDSSSGNDRIITKILFLTANPSDTSRLKIDKEVKKIQTNFKLAKDRDKLEFKQEWAVTAETLMQALLDESPHIVHFSGHGKTEGILLEDDNSNTSTPLPMEVLTNLFKLFKDTVQCVILNACFSEPQAEVIKAHIPYVIGMKAELSDRAAIAFSAGFYKAIGAGRSIPFAFDYGVTAMQAYKEDSGENLPILLQ